MTSGRVSRASHVSDRVSNCQPMTSASAGKMGRMYEGSFDPDALKNRKMTGAHTSAKRCQLKRFAASGASRQARYALHANTLSQGSMPPIKIGTKYHHAPSRRCSVVRKRVKCSWMKKNWKNSGLRTETTANQGTASRQKTMAPETRCSRRHNAQSRCS